MGRARATQAHHPLSLLIYALSPSLSKQPLLVSYCAAPSYPRGHTHTSSVHLLAKVSHLKSSNLFLHPVPRSSLCKLCSSLITCSIERTQASKKERRPEARSQVLSPGAASPDGEGCRAAVAGSPTTRSTSSSPSCRPSSRSPPAAAPRAGRRRRSCSRRRAGTSRTCTGRSTTSPTGCRSSCPPWTTTAPRPRSSGAYSADTS